jgi:hypothetical protein
MKTKYFLIIGIVILLGVGVISFISINKDNKFDLFDKDLDDKNVRAITQQLTEANKPDYYFVSDSINVNDFWINKYDDNNYGTVSKISMDLNNSNNYLNDKTVQIVIAYPENQDFLNLVLTPTNENGKDGLAGNREISKEDINILEVKTKTKNSNDKEISDKLKNISKEGKERLEIENIKGYEYKTFDVNLNEDEGYIIQAYISSEYGLNEELYMYVLGSFAGGTGTSGDPYQVSNWTNLNDLRSYLTSSFILINDLDSSTGGYDTFASPSANAGAGWFPIGNSSYQSDFRGTFDGQNYTIDDLYIYRTTTDITGLFGQIDNSNIRNIIFTNVSVSGRANVGSLIGTATNNAIVNNVHSTGKVNGTTIVGGLVGYTDLTITIISECSSNGVVNATGNYAGGLVGSLGWILNTSYSTADVNSSAGAQAGGLVGRVEGEVHNSYANGSVQSLTVSGGLVGALSSAYINKSYSTGAVFGTTRGGLVQSIYLSGVNNSFWDNQTSGIGTSAGGTGKLTSQMQTLETFSTATWSIAEIDSFTNEIWFIDNTTNYPKLFWEYAVSGEDTTPPTYSNNATNNTQISLSTNFSIDVNDNTALQNNGYYIFSTNNTGIWVNESSINFTSTPQSIYTIKDLNDTVGISIGYRWYLYDNVLNEAITPIYVLTTTSAVTSCASYNSLTEEWYVPSGCECYYEGDEIEMNLSQFSCYEL